MAASTCIIVCTAVFPDANQQLHHLLRAAELYLAALPPLSMGLALVELQGGQRVELQARLLPAMLVWRHQMWACLVIHNWTVFAKLRNSMLVCIALDIPNTMSKGALTAPY